MITKFLSHNAPHNHRKLSKNLTRNVVMIDRCLGTLNHVKLFHVRTYKAHENRWESTNSCSAALLKMWSRNAKCQITSIIIGLWVLFFDSFPWLWGAILERNLVIIGHCLRTLNLTCAKEKKTYASLYPALVEMYLRMLLCPQHISNQTDARGHGCVGAQ